jgi:TRAP-type C4-dicarboxylate transport system substrate-binding protein
MKKSLKFFLAATTLVASAGTLAQTVTLKVHHFLPAGSVAQTLFIKPWCDKIAVESGDKMKCQIYPSMQLGGTPPQLFDQVKDGLADLIWVLPGYTAGRFPLTEVFELPFLMQNPEGTSKALWDTSFFQRNPDPFTLVAQFEPDGSVATDQAALSDLTVNKGE